MTRAPETETAAAPYPVLTGDLDLSRPAAYADRLSFWGRVRREAPVAFSPTLGMWVVSSYDRVSEVVRDTTRFGKQSGRPPIVELLPEAAEVYEEFTREYVPTFETNPPVHTSYRQKVLPALSAPRMEARRPIIEQMAGELIDEFADAGSADVVDAFCVPLPVLHSFAMIGVPAADTALVRRLSIASMEMQFGLPAPEDQVAVAEGCVGYWRYLLALVEDHRTSKSDDVVDDLLAGTGGPDDAPLTNAEIASLLWSIIRGSHRTTTNLVGNTLHALLSEPGLWRRVVAEPQLARIAVDESLRRDAPAPGHFYCALVDTELGGVPIRAGDNIYPVFASANHDDTHFADVGTFDLDRVQDHQSLAFSAGPHLCPGKALGRVTGSAAVETFARRLPASRLLDPTAYWIPSVTTHGLARLDIGWDDVARA